MQFIQRSTILFFSVLAGSLSLIATPASSAPTCTTYRQDIRAASRASDPNKAVRLFRKAEQNRACTGLALKKLGRRVAHVFYFKAYADGVTSEKQTHLLNEGLRYGRPWRLLAAAADMAKERKDYGRATSLYAEALDDINDELLHPAPKAPPQKIIAQIHKKAETTRLLAPQYVAHKNRSGESGGLSLGKFRGFEPKATAVPINFEYDAIKFAPNGFRAVRDMLDYLKQQGSPNITLIGHTDERGAKGYNLNLSARRADAVKDWLMNGGYEGRISTKGLGESKSFISDDPGSYTQAERWQLDRRVELVR